MIKYLSVIIFIVLAISCAKDKNKEFQYVNEYNGAQGSVKSVFWTSDDTHYNIYLCLDEVADFEELFKGESPEYLLVSVDKQLVGQASDLKKEQASFMIADHTSGLVFSDVTQGDTEAIASGSLKIKSISDKIQIEIALKSASQPQKELTLSYSGEAQESVHSWSASELPSKFFYDKSSYVKMVLYDAAAIDDNIYYFYDNLNATSADTPILEVHLQEKIAVDGAPLQLSDIVSVRLPDGTELG